MNRKEFIIKYGSYGLDVLKSYDQVDPLLLSGVLGYDYIPYVNKMLTAPGNTLEVRVAYSFEDCPTVTQEHVAKIVKKIINNFGPFWA